MSSYMRSAAPGGAEGSPLGALTVILALGGRTASRVIDVIITYRTLRTPRNSKKRAYLTYPIILKTKIRSL